MNILSFSCTNGVHSHLIPLYVLNQRYFRRMPEVKSFFLLPENLHQQYEHAGISVLPIDFSLFGGNELEEVIRNEGPNGLENKYRQFTEKINAAYELSKADIVIDDNEIFSTLIAGKYNTPRISIFRTGFFRSIDRNHRNPSHMHSMEKAGMGNMLDASIILKPKSSLSQLRRKFLKTTYLKDDVDYLMNYLDPKTKLIPGIPSIERLPDDITDKHSFFYTGPLLVEDNPSLQLSKDLREFFEYNKTRNIVFITSGLVEQDDIQEMIIYLLNNGYAVISTRKLNNFDKHRDRFLSGSFLPLNLVCSKVDLIIHHCGSGMYHYPLIHEKPVITFGTQCYDREDIALRLQELKLSRHVPSPRDDDHYMEIFIDSVKAFEKEEISDYTQLKIIKEEINKTMLDFDMDEVLNFTLNTSTV